MNVSGIDWTYVSLWLAVALSGTYHGLSPAMGWPLAVSAALFDREPRAFARALSALATGHFTAMLIVLLPFASLAALVTWQREIRIAAAVIVMGFGAYRLLARRHPRALARILPSQIGLWSFAVAIAHGAGLMHVPIYLGLCGVDAVDAGHVAARNLMGTNLTLAVIVSGVHTVAMIATGGTLGWLVYRYLGLQFITRSWFNLDAVWSLTLILVGGLSLALSL